MDFLRSSSSDANRIVLLLIVANQGITRLLLYKWDSTRSLSTLRPLQRSGYRLPNSDAFPHLLIPSCRHASFAIVVGQVVVFYDDIESKKIRRLEVQLEVTPDSDSDKQWVQWAKPVRHEEHRKRKEDIFIVREDGLLRTVIGAHDLTKRQSITIKPGHLKINVDTAVCALSAPPTTGGDILIACGDTTEGGVFHLAARAEPCLLQRLPNWSPINDFIHLEQNSSPSMPDQGTVVAATGIHEGRSALTELRYGIEADVLWTSGYEEAKSIDRLWALERLSERRLLLLASHHEHTTLLMYDIDSGDIAADDATVYPHLCLDRPTLAAAITPEDFLIQITTNSINITGPNQGLEVLATTCAIDTFLCTDIHRVTGIWVAAGRQGDKILLTGGGVQINEMEAIETSEVPKPLIIDTVPVALTICMLGTYLMCLIAGQDGALRLYAVHPEDGFRHQSTWAISDLDATISLPQISSISILSFTDESDHLVICGLKTGKVIILALKESPENIGSYDLQLERSVLLGTTAVYVRNESTIYMEAERAAHIVCGTSLFRLVLHKNKAGLDFTFSPMFVADRGLSSTLPAPITAVDRVGRFPRSSSSTDYDPSGALAIVSGEDLSMLTIGPSTMLPRHIRSTGTTKHLVYSTHLGKYIVSNQSRPTNGSPKAPSAYAERPSLIVVDPKSPSSADDLALQRSLFHFGEKNEKIRVLMHWTPADSTSHYNMIVIGSDVENEGRVSYMNVLKMSHAKANPVAKVFARYKKKSINAICAYGMSSLVICAGRELKILHLELATRRWVGQGEFTLPSRATELSTKGSVIYVATSEHSFMLIREKEGKLEMIGSDQWASRARNIVTYGNSSTLVNLVSERGTRILNFAERPTEGKRPTFEARLPQAIDKMAHLKLSATSDGRDRFLGTTICGTVYLFSTLTEPEMKLMRFLEQLCEPKQLQTARNASQLAQAIAQRYASRLESADIAAPILVSSHARGDVLKALLAQGPYDIRFLLQKRAKLKDDFIKQEDELDDLKHVAEPVVGKVDDIVDGVILWLRRTLNVPSF